MRFDCPVARARYPTETNKVRLMCVMCEKRSDRESGCGFEKQKGKALLRKQGGKTNNGYEATDDSANLTSTNIALEMQDHDQKHVEI